MSYQDRREREMEARRRQILAASMRLFAQKGFAGTTMDEIATEADFTKVTVYKYFRSKQELLGSLLLQNMQTLLGWFDEADAAHADPQQRLFAYGEIFLRFMRSEVPSSLGSFLLHLDFNSQDMSAELRRSLSTHFARLFDHVRALIASGADTKSFKNNLDATRLSLLVWGATIGLQIIKMKLTPHILPEFGEDVFAEILNLLPTGLLEPKQT